MSRRGNPYDNAFAESFMKTLKHEEVNLQEYQDYEDAYTNIHAFIEGVYNTKRLHGSIGYQTPIEHEQNTTQKNETNKTPTNPTKCTPTRVHSSVGGKGV